MTKIEAVKWYGNLPDDSRMKLQSEFNIIYDNLGSRETKFFRWIKYFNKSKQKEYMTTTVTQEILEKVKAVLKQFPEGEQFFDALDGEIIANCSDEVIFELFKLVPENSFIVLSGGFGKKIADRIDKEELPQVSYILYEGGIRKGNQPKHIRTKQHGAFSLDDDIEGVFLDDSIYGGATYRALQTVLCGKLTSCIVIYDGCPIKKNDISSLFRFYDHFQATPNYSF